MERAIPINLSLAAGAALALVFFTTAQGDTLSRLAGTYAIQASSSIRFSVDQIGGGGISGMFEKFSGNFVLHPRDISRSQTDFSLIPASVVTGEPRVENFLRSSAVFDTAEYPEISFRSIEVKPSGPDTAKILGILSVRGKAHEETFTAKLLDHDGQNIAFRVEGDILRSRYGMDVGTPIYSNIVHFDMIMRGRKS
jgi:polyisoprenoid-binding protein YceI